MNTRTPVVRRVGITSLRFVLIAALVGGLAGSAGCGSLIVTQQSVAALEGRGSFEWETHEADGFVIYFEPGTDAAASLDVITADALAARKTVLAYLEEPPYEPIVSIFVVASRDRMKDLIGRRSNATGYHTSNAICIVWANDLQVGTAHELLHVIAMNRWGVPERWVNEGAAVDASGPWRGHDPHAVCKVLRERGELPSLETLTRRFDRQPGLASYPAAGSFVRYVRETYGLATLREIWDGGRRALPTATGHDLDALEAAWLARVDAADTTGVEYDL